MKSRILAVCFGLIALLPLSARASSGGPFGLGIVLGDPTGLSAQYALQSDRKLDFGLAWSVHSLFVIDADAIFLFPHFISNLIQRSSPLAAYAGIGAILTIGDNRHDTEFGARIPLGLEWRLQKDPLGFFLELVPVLTLVPGTDADFQGGIGARYFF